MSKKETQNARCISRNPRDRKRCKMEAIKDTKFCEHHNFDLAALVQNQSACIDIMEDRFPKKHHPACNSKGENDCNCADYSRGAHAMITLKKSFEQSKLLSPLYKRHLKVTMADKVRRIRTYYNKLKEEDIYLPPNSNFRQYRFFTWEPKSQRIIVRVLKDNIRTPKIMLSHLKRLAPLHVYYTTGQWLNPQGIGPDPEGRHAKRKFRKKKWVLRKYHNTLMKRGLYFDVDYDNKDYNEGIKMVQLLLDNFDNYISNLSWGPSVLPAAPDTTFNWDIVFSGGKGFHLIENDFYDKFKLPKGVANTSKKFINLNENLISISEYWKNVELEILEQRNWNKRKKFLIEGASQGGSSKHFLSRLERQLTRDAPTRVYLLLISDLTNTPIKPRNTFGGTNLNWKENNAHDMLKINKSRFVSLLYKAICEGLMTHSDNKLLLDWMVTYDSRRIIRLPQTINAKTMQICTLLDGPDDKRIIKDKNGKFIGYNADGPIP